MLTANVVQRTRRPASRAPIVSGTLKPTNVAPAPFRTTLIPICCVISIRQKLTSAVIVWAGSSCARSILGSLSANGRVLLVDPGTLKVAREIPVGTLPIGITVLMVEHVMEIVMPLVDRAIVLDLGKVLVEGKPADVVTVFEQLQMHGKAEECGGIAYLNALAQSVPSAANLRRYAEIVRERAILRNHGRDAREISAEKHARLHAARGVLGGQRSHHPPPPAPPRSA